MIVRDALTLGPRRGIDTVTPHTRPPTDEDADHLLVRMAICLEGEVEMELTCEPVFDYGRVPATWSVADDGHRADATAQRRMTIRLQTDMAVGHRGRPRARPARAPSRASRSSARSPGPRSWRLRRRSTRRTAQLAATAGFWRDWLGRARIPDHRWRDPIQRSALAIKGLTYMPTGATVAALTTSLPETPGGERNWDYRYTWLRDSTFTLQALHYLNLDWEAEEFMQFVADLEPNADGALQIMYGIDGRRDLTESTRDDLSGYAGASPVRIGNGAFDQRQNDVFGAALDSILLHTPPQPAAAAAAVAARAGAGRVRDEGLAQARPGHLGGARQAQALRLLEADVLGGDGPRCQARGDARRREAAEHAGSATAEEIRADILKHGFTDGGVLRQHYDTDALDASNLLAGDLRLPAGRRRAPARERAGDRRRPHRGRLRAALPHRARPTTACPARREAS